MEIPANVLGLAAGEWKGAPVNARRRLYAGIMVLPTAMIGLRYANRLA
jgi:hypothetical protein